MDKLLTIAILIIVGLCCVHSLEGPNVCTKEESYPVETQVSTHIPYEVKTIGWCLAIPPRCRKTRIAYRIGYRIETRVKTREVESCCSGYTNSGDRCIPICANSCIHGHCVAPDKCECQPGWNGFNCNVSCLKDKWGLRCENNCTCLNNAKCDAVSGVCSCSLGWRGDNCDQPCQEGYFGVHCVQLCQCEHGKCNHIDGSCDCQPGYGGPLCKDKLEPGTQWTLTTERTTELTTKLTTDRTTAQPSESLRIQHSAASSVNSSDNSSDNYSGGLILAICLILFLLVIAILLVIYYRKRLERLKHEMAYVSYSAEVPPDQRHFDNPVYSSLPANKVKNFPNNLSKNNIEKEKLKNASVDEAYSSTLLNCGVEASNIYSEVDERNKIKDTTFNPNIYHSIDDFKGIPDKKEPFYDEIKRNSAEGECSHDNQHYDRPRNDIMPNNQRIDDSKNGANKQTNNSNISVVSPNLTLQNDLNSET